MKKGASYLRYAAAAVFLAAAAWTLAFFIGREQSPETVRAERAEVRISVVAEGTVWRRETVLVCDDAGAYLARKPGDRVSGGSVVAVENSVLDDYLTHLELSGGAQVINGVGFLGAGSIILTGRKRVKGLTTAAGLWASACLGLAIGAGYYECVAVSVALILVCMYAFPALENRLIQRSRYMNILAELDGMECLGGVLAALREQGVTVFDIDLSKQPEDRRAQLGVHLSVYLPKGLNHTELLAQLAALGGTVSIEESQ